MRQTIANLISPIEPFDELESQHIKETLEWIKSGKEIFRLQKPAIPPKHLVSYFLLLDDNTQKILLVDHKKAQLWLPSGGHVELNEHPKTTVEREILEELNCHADFMYDNPFFLTVTDTVGMEKEGLNHHIDVSLWYVLKGSSYHPLQFDENEFNTIQWFSFDQIPYPRTDPHMKRFMDKLQSVL